MGELLENYSTLFSISRFEKGLKANGLAGSKRTISNYLGYLQEAFFLIANEKFAHSPRKRLMNPKKIYLVDTGFAALGGSFSQNRGRILENLVAVEFNRRGEQARYFKGRGECDLSSPATAAQPRQSKSVGSSTQATRSASWPASPRPHAPSTSSG